jgi:hypothetical protein
LQALSAQAFTDLAAQGRADLEGRLLANSEVLLRWQDGTPWLVRRRVGLGIALAVGLPSSVRVSDFALRPGFLALLDGAVTQATGRLRPSHTAVGEAWAFRDLDVTIREPDGALVSEHAFAEPHRTFTPSYRGRYELEATRPGGKLAKVERLVHLTAREILSPSQEPVPGAARAASAAGPGLRDGSRHVVWALVTLLGLELALRIRRFFRARVGLVI